MTENPTDLRPWGRFASLVLGALALLAGQVVALATLRLWYGRGLSELPNLGGDGVAVSLIILVSTPVTVALLLLFARPRGDPLRYLGLIPPTRGQTVFGVAAIVALIVVLNAVSLALGRDIVTPFQSDITRTAGSAGWLVLLWLAVVVVAPAGEELLFRGFLFRGLMRTPRDTWPAIVVTAALFALLHVQYDWFVIGQIFAFGLLLGWMRWASGSTVLTFLLHALINFEGMLETMLLS
ncbi:MAG: lysostaphin resistance A-like protein [Pseudolabrys sp.]